MVEHGSIFPCIVQLVSRVTSRRRYRVEHVNTSKSMRLVDVKASPAKSRDCNLNHSKLLAFGYHVASLFGP